MRRALFAALTLALVVPGGVVAQEPSPEATPLFAPSDLAFTLPTRVGDYEVTITSAHLDIDAENREFYRDWLLPLGKTPDDVLAVQGLAHPLGNFDSLSEEGPAISLIALRVQGVPATVSLEGFLAGIPSGFFGDRSWRVVDGQDVYAVVPTAEQREELGAELTETGMYLYPKGEVFYAITVPFDYPDTVPSLAEILAEMP